MNWMIYQGAKDPIFPSNFTMDYYDSIFEALNITTTMKIRHIEPGMSHVTTAAELKNV